MDLRVFLLDRPQFLPHRVINLDVRRALGALDGEAEHLTPVHGRNGALFAIKIPHFGDVRQFDGATAANGDIGFAQRIRIARVAQHTDRLFSACDFGTSARCVDVALAQLIIDLRRRNAERLELGRIKDDTDFARNAAFTVDGRRPRHALKALDHHIVDIPAQLLQRHVDGFGGDIGDGLTRGVNAVDLRLKNAVWQIAADLGQRIADVVDAAVDIGANLELDEGHRHAFTHGRVDFIHAVDRPERRLDDLRHLFFQFGRRCPRLADDHLRAGKFNVRVVVHVHPAEADDTRQQQGHEKHNRRNRVANAPGRDVPEVHGTRPQFDLGRTGTTLSPGLRKAPAVSTTRSRPVSPVAIVMPASETDPIFTSRRSTLFCAFTMKT